MTALATTSAPATAIEATTAAAWRAAVVAAYRTPEPAWLVAAHRPVARVLVAALDIRPGERVLDVGAGTGTAARLAAARNARTTAVDLVPAQAARGAAAGGAVRWAVGAAEALPFPDAAFTVVLSSLGVVYSADPARALTEFRRVLVPGGRAGVAAPAADGFAAEAAAVLDRHGGAGPAPVRPGDWGDPVHLRTWFAHWDADVRLRSLESVEHHASPEAFWADALLRRRPVRALARALPPDALPALRRDYLAAARRHADPAAPGFRLRHGYLVVTVRSRDGARRCRRPGDGGPPRPGNPDRRPPGVRHVD